MEKFGSLALEVEEWRCVSMALGAPSVMTSGTTKMPVWCADSWDTPHMVCLYTTTQTLNTGLLAFHCYAHP